MIRLFFKVKTSTIFHLLLRCVGGMQGRCTLVRVILLLLDKSSMVDYVITTNIILLWDITNFCD